MWLIDRPIHHALGDAMVAAAQGEVADLVDEISPRASKPRLEVTMIEPRS